MLHIIFFGNKEKRNQILTLGFNHISFFFCAFELNIAVPNLSWVAVEWHSLFSFQFQSKASLWLTDHSEAHGNVPMFFGFGVFISKNFHWILSLVKLYQEHLKFLKDWQRFSIQNHYINFIKKKSKRQIR